MFRRELAVFAVDPERVSADRRGEIEAHIAACAECQEWYDFFRIGEDDLLQLSDFGSRYPSRRSSPSLST